MNAFPAIRIVGGLLGPDILDQFLTGDLPGQQPRDFGLAGRRSLTDEIASVFADARTQWQVFRHRLERVPETDPATSVTRYAWMIPFLRLLGYELQYTPPRAFEMDRATFAISHRAGDNEDALPVHIVGARQELGRVPPTRRPRLAPHSLVQEFLNRTERLWGLVTNGSTLRRLRDNSIRRQAYVEFDLQQILEEQRFHDFAVLYRLLHRTRLPRSVADARQRWLEKYYQHSLEQGGRVRERLRDGVEQCLTRLANGFLAHRANSELRRPVLNGEWRMERRVASGHWQKSKGE